MPNCSLRLGGASRVAVLLVVALSGLIANPDRVVGQPPPQSGSGDASASRTRDVLTSMAQFAQHFGRDDIASLPVDLIVRVNYWDHRNHTVFVEDAYDASYVEVIPKVFETWPTVPPGARVHLVGDLILEGHFLRARELEVLESDGEPVTPLAVRMHELTLGNHWSHRVQTEGVLVEVLHVGHDWQAAMQSGDTQFVVHRYDRDTPHFWTRLLGQRLGVTGTLSCEIGQSGLPSHYMFLLNEHDAQPQPVGETQTNAATPKPAKVSLGELVQLKAPTPAYYLVEGQVTATWSRKGYLIEANGTQQFIHSQLATEAIDGHRVSLLVTPESETGWRTVAVDAKTEAVVPPARTLSPREVISSGLPARGRFEGELVSVSSQGDRRFLLLRDEDVEFVAVVDVAGDVAWQELQVAGARRLIVEGLAVASSKEIATLDLPAEPDFVVEAVNADSLQVVSRWWQLAPSWVIAALALLAGLCTVGMICFATLWLRVQHADRTNRRLSSELLHQQKMDALGRLAGGVAHDFNNLLVGIASNLELIERDRAISSPQTRQCLDSARRCSRQATRLVRSLLGFSRQADLELVAGDLNRMIGEAVLLARSILGPGIDVQLDLDERLPPCRFDQVQLEQVLLNLCFNARDAIGNVPGKVTIHTTSDKSDPTAPLAVITFRDNGSGMEDETCARIFEPFFTTKAVGEGTGLGLSQAYGIVEQHGGTIECRSTPGVGTAFKITLPVPAAENRESSIESSSCDRDDQLLQPGLNDRGRFDSDSRTGSKHKSTDETENSSWHVLLVDDDDDVRRATRLVLETIGHRVTTAADGLEAIGQIERGLAPDLVVLDLLMPAISGAETFCQLKTVCPDLPVIVCSGLMSEVERMPELCQRSPEACLAKPFELADLSATIDRVMQFRSGGSRKAPV